MVQTRSSSPALSDPDGGGGSSGGVLAAIPSLPSRPAVSAAASAKDRSKKIRRSIAKNSITDSNGTAADATASSAGTSSNIRTSASTAAASATSSGRSTKRAQGRPLAAAAAASRSGSDAKSSSALKVSAKVNATDASAVTTAAVGANDKQGIDKCLVVAELSDAIDGPGAGTAAKALAVSPKKPMSGATKARRPTGTATPAATVGGGGGGASGRSTGGRAGGKPPIANAAGGKPPKMARVNSAAAAAAATASTASLGKPPTPRAPDQNTSTGNKRSFLSGVNLECSKTDVLALPDPPSPDGGDDDDGAAARARKDEQRAKRRRRMSTGSALKRVADGGGEVGKLDTRPTGAEASAAPAAPAAARGVVFDDNAGSGNRGGKRKVRNSLSHVPSPAESLYPNGDATQTATKGGKAVNDGHTSTDIMNAASPQKRGIVFDDDDDIMSEEDVTKSKRRRRKRQSVFLPSDMESSDASMSTAANPMAMGFYSDLLNYKNSASSADSNMSICSNSSDIELNGIRPTGTSSVASEASQGNSDPSTSHLLLQAVREICSLPEEKRFGSDQAKVIELLGGYPYIPPAEKKRIEEAETNGKSSDDGLNWTFSPGKAAACEKPANDPPLSPADPIAETMEKKRELILTLGPVVERMEAKKKEEVEAARTATDCRVSRTRKGRYKYYDVETDEEVTPEEYKRRYCAMLERLREERMNGQGRVDGIEESAAMDEKLTAQDDVKPSEASKDADAVAYADEAEDSSAHVTVESTSIDEGEGMSSVQDIEEVTARVEEGDSHSPNAEKSLSIGNEAAFPTEEESATSPQPQQHQLQDQRTSSSSAAFPVLPLPDRDEPDSDPQIAAAEQRLWSEIDAALTRYSREVICIRKARKMGFTLSQTVD